MADVVLEIDPVTPERWDDLAALFGPSGAYGGCWCMYFRQTSKEFEACKGEQNRTSLAEIVAADAQPGLLAYRDGEPAGWIAVQPREEFGRVLRSRVLKPADDLDGVWSIPCFFVARSHRRQGVSRALLDAAVDHAAQRGAVALEGYPYDVTEAMSAAEAYVGTVSLFAAAGFEIVEPIRAPKRRVMRRLLAKDD